MTETSAEKPATPTASPQPAGESPRPPVVKAPPGEIGGPKGPEPTRFGDWERNGRCVDF